MNMYDLLPHGPIRGVEVGIFEGGNAARMLAKFPQLDLTGIDPFEGYQDWCGFLGDEYMSGCERAAWSILQGFADQGRFRLIKKYSDAALVDLEDGAYDFVYVDGDHSYRWVLHDVTNYWSKVRPGGVLCGHDRSLPEVRRAVDEFCASVGCNLLTSEEPQSDSWYVIKPGA